MTFALTASTVPAIFFTRANSSSWDFLAASCVFFMALVVASTFSSFFFSDASPSSSLDLSFSISMDLQ